MENDRTLPDPRARFLGVDIDDPLAAALNVRPGKVRVVPAWGVGANVRTANGGSGTTATLTVGSGIVHPMSSSHYISAAWVRDQTGMVVFYQAFATDGAAPPVASRPCRLDLVEQIGSQCC